jgi:hypothetical protein
MNHKKLRRLYTEERLQVRRRGGRKRALGAHSGDHERSNRSIMNTESGDHEHAPAVS